MRNLLTLLALLFSFSAIAQVSTTTLNQTLDKNYLTNGGFENGKIGYATYKNTAQALPVSGTGGSPSVTLTVSTSSPIADKASGILTKGASNLQGEGISYNFSVEPAAKGSQLTISGLYQIVSGTYSGGTSTTDSDVEVYVYDVDAGQLIQPSGYKLDGGVTGLSFPYKINATFQSSSSSTNYRLILHVATTSTAAYSLRLDQIKVSMQSKSQGPPIGDLKSYTPTFSSPFGSPTNINFTYRRIGDSLHVMGVFTPGSITIAAPGSISLPSGLSIDTTKITVTNTTASAGMEVGSWFNNAAANNAGAIVVAPGTSSSLVYFGVNTNSSGMLIAGNVNTFMTGGGVVSVDFTVPIAGWSANTLMSDSADTKVIFWSGQTNATTALTATPTTINFTTIADKTSGYSSGTYTVSVPGSYKLKARVPLNPVSTGNGFLGAYKNGTQLPAVDYIATSTGAIVMGLNIEYTGDFVAGDQITFKVWNSVGGQTLLGSTVGAYATASIEKMSGPSQIAASDSVSARYTDVSGGTLATTATVFKYQTKVWDNTSGYSTTTGSFTCPAPGKMEVKASLRSGVGTLTTSQGFLLYAYKNGSLYAPIATALGTGAANFYHAVGSTLVDCLAGDTIAVYALWGGATAPAADTTTTFNWVTFNRVSN